MRTARLEIPEATRNGASAVATFLRRVPLRRRPSRLHLVAAAAVVVAGGGWLVLGRGSDASVDPTALRRAGTTTVPVERRTLVARETVDGTLGYGDARSVTSASAGVVTRLPEPGARLERGDPFFEVDGRPGPVLMYGSQPAYRTLEQGIADGPDVEQLEQNLKALGYDPTGAMTVDGHFDFATRAIVERWQRDVGLAPTGRVELGRVVFLPGARRVGKHETTAGSRVAAGAPVLQTTSATRLVKVKLATDKQTYVAVGDGVTVLMPDGSTVNGKIAKVGNVATTDEEGNSTIEVIVALADGKRGAGLDEAPVSVSIAKETKRNVLAVPATALVTLTGGAYAVEVEAADGTRRLVRVTPGLFADGYVEISGKGIREGMKVVVPR